MEAFDGWNKIDGHDSGIDSGAEGIITVTVKDRKICMTRRSGNWYAFSKVCPHAGGLLSDGYVDAAGNVVCPLHSYRFSLKSGFNSSGEGYRLKTYPVEIREDGIYVKINEPGIKR